MILRAIEDERFQDYKVPCMYIAFPSCTFKCDKECGRQICQNRQLTHTQRFGILTPRVVRRYLKNPITKAIVAGGLEPIDSLSDVMDLLECLRIKYQCDDDFVIYTGYTLEELNKMGVLDQLKTYKNIILKVGRYLPDYEKHFDVVLGVELASPNQYGIKIS